MKICIDCGKILEDNTEACECAQVIKNKALHNPVLEIVRQSVKSKLFLWAMIIYTIAVVINMFNDWFYLLDNSIYFGTLDFCYYNLADIFSRIGVNDGKGMLILFFGCTGVFSGLASAIPSILLVVGAWLAYGFVKEEDNHSAKPNGFSLVEKTLILFAGFAFWGALLTLFAATLFFSSSLVEFSGWKDIVALVYLLISPFLQIAVAMLYTNTYRMVKNIRASIEKRVVTEIRPICGKMAIVFGCLSIVFTIISSAVIFQYPFDILISNFISAIPTILFGVFLLIFCSSINNFIKTKADINQLC